MFYFVLFRVCSWLISLSYMIQTILLDIEGTCAPIDFVHKTLFPYAKVNIGDYVAQHFADIQTEITQLKTEYKKDFSDQLYGRDFREDSPETITNYLQFLIDADRKSTPLKSLQGKIWQKGYESGELESVMYEDVPRAFRRWKDSGKTIVIFSSGSVLAQKLIFKYSNYGDLTGYISDYFDTIVGGKREAESYRQIASAMSFPQVENFLFISDVPAELDAARTAGMQTALSARPGNPAIEEETAHRIIQSFDEIE